ncbi:hypothetical protein L2E82_31056 [Cichorium intybus]|uniref:Uncharacterized protein n=1 Tax=Cichorium intybus TaxID=13427 RepID=A0ACB9D1U1_CICIN|nr:hypothetical protein L2E82_31056 [Cichorium intybus]
MKEERGIFKTREERLCDFMAASVKKDVSIIIHGNNETNPLKGFLVSDFSADGTLLHVNVLSRFPASNGGCRPAILFIYTTVIGVAVSTFWCLCYSYLSPILSNDPCLSLINVAFV